MLSAALLPLLAAGSVLAIVIQEPFFGFEDPPHLPPFPFPRPKPPTHTVYDLIRDNKKYTKLNKAINFVGDDFISVLNNTEHEITFFAVPDKALLPPRDHDHDHGGDDDHKQKKKSSESDANDLFDLGFADSSSIDAGLKVLLLDKSVGLKEALEVIERFEANTRVMATVGDDDGDDDDDEPGHEKRREVYRHIVKAILNYHVLPFGAYDVGSLAHNTTWPTNFVVPKLFGGHGQRIMVTEHVEKVDADKKKKKKKKEEEMVTRINLYAEIMEADIRTDNGYVHVLNHPLLPPPAVFQELFLAQQHFSTLTSALQRVGLTDELDVRYIKDADEDHGHLEGSTAVTIFAPTNKAFESLPIRFKLWLFSAFGQRVLRKLLEYHIVPNVIAHSDVLFNQTAETSPDTILAPKKAATGWSLFGLPALDSEEPISSVKATLNTRLFKHTVDFSAEKFKITHKHREVYKTRVYVNREPIAMADFVALNGAIHSIDHLLCPCERRPHASSMREMGNAVATDPWEDWESCVAQLSVSI